MRRFCGQARDLQYRSGRAVHFCGLRFGAAASTNPRQHGWARMPPRRRVHRAALAAAEIRTDLSRRLRQAARNSGQPWTVVTFTSFQAWNGQPRVILYDNLKAAVLERRQSDSVQSAPAGTQRSLSLGSSALSGAGRQRERACGKSHPLCARFVLGRTDIHYSG